MKEIELRKWHRQMGVVLAILIVLQAGTGLVITLADPAEEGENSRVEVPVQEEPEEDGVFETIHKGGGGLGVVYRIVVGLGMLGMAASGTSILMKIQARQSGGKKA